MMRFLVLLLFVSVQSDVILNGALIPGGNRRKPMPTYYSPEHSRQLSQQSTSLGRQLRGILQSIVDEIRPAGQSYSDDRYMYDNERGVNSRVENFGNRVRKTTGALLDNGLLGITESLLDSAGSLLGNTGGISGNRGLINGGVARNIQKGLFG